MVWYERWTCISCVVRNIEAFFVISQLEWGVRKYIGPNDLDFILLFQLQIYKIQDGNKVLKHCMEEILGAISKDSKLSNLSMKWLMEWWWVIDGTVNDWWSGGKWLMEWWMIDGVVVKWFVEWWWHGVMTKKVDGVPKCWNCRNYFGVSALYVIWYTVH